MGGPEATACILNSAHTIILHQVPEPEQIVKAAGTKMATEWSLQHEHGLSTDVGSTRTQHQLRVDSRRPRLRPKTPNPKDRSGYGRGRRIHPAL
jgi:hypothetical protein